MGWGRFYSGSVHCRCGLKILIHNGSGLQIQTNGVGWVGTNIRGVEVGNGMVSNIRQVRWVGMEHPPDRANGTQPNILGFGYDFFADYASFLIIYFINNQIVETFQGLTT